MDSRRMSVGLMVTAVTSRKTCSYSVTDEFDSSRVVSFSFIDPVHRLLRGKKTRRGELGGC
jgi:hypothetical protein